MGYVEELRKIIGHRRIILNGSVAIIEDGDGRILMQQRAYPRGRWGLPGGLMELGESTEETARREVFEETGLRLGPLTLLGVYSGEGYLCVAENGDEYYVVTTAYIATEYEGALTINDGESLALEWIDGDHLPDDIPKTHSRIIADWRARRR